MKRTREYYVNLPGIDWVYAFNDTQEQSNLCHRDSDFVVSCSFGHFDSDLAQPITRGLPSGGGHDFDSFRKFSHSMADRDSVLDRAAVV